MKYIGAHVSIGAGVENAPKNALNIGGRAFAMFTRNQRQWFSKPFTEENISRFKKTCIDGGLEFDYILPHDSYLINLGHPERNALEKSRAAFLDELRRCERLGLRYLNFHPGSHLNRIDPEECLEKIAESINWALMQTKGVMAVIENTAGQGTNMGSRFEHLAKIIRSIHDKTRIGVCLDTCHTYAAGYDIRSIEAFEDTLKEFDQVVGMKYIKALHLNDSKNPLGSRIDRHDSIGKGVLGLEPFRFIVNDPRFENMPLILETPDPYLWKYEIELLYSQIY